MKYLLMPLVVIATFVPGVTSAQTQPPQQTPQPQTQTQPAPQPKPRGTSGATAPRAVGLAVEVTDRTGNPLGDVQVSLAGPVERSGATDPQGAVAFRSLRAGTYRLRFEHEGFATFEREVVVSRTQGATVSVALNAEPEEPEPAPAPVAAPTPPAPAAPTVVAEPRTLSIPDFLDKNLVRSSEPARSSVLACAQGGTARLMQVREPLENQTHSDVDEIVYVVAGEGTIRIQDKESKLTAGYFALVPRGAPHAIRRQGRNPLIFVSVLAGTPCTEPVR